MLMAHATVFGLIKPWNRGTSYRKLERRVFFSDPRDARRQSARVGKRKARFVFVSEIALKVACVNEA